MWGALSQEERGRVGTKLSPRSKVRAEWPGREEEDFSLGLTGKEDARLSLLPWELMPFQGEGRDDRPRPGPGSPQRHPRGAENKPRVDQAEQKHMSLTK